MKKIFLPAALLVVSCNKLSENPNSEIVSSQFYKTSSDAVAAVTAVYSTLNSDPAGDFPIYGRNLNLLIENASDNQVYSPSNTNPDVRALGTETYVSSNDRVHKTWQQHYYGISRANVAIDNIPQIPLTQFADTTLRPRLVREAKFIRALLYFNLVRMFGPVPLVLHDPATVNVNALKIPRSSVDSIYAQIINDLNDATQLPAIYTGANIGRATSGAAHALLAKVYVTRRDWTDALSEIDTVTNSGLYGLFPNFRDAFQKATKNGIEHIFSVQFESNLGAVNSEQFLSLSFASFNTSVWPADVPADSSVSQLFSNADTRKVVTFYTTQYNAATGQTVVFQNAYTPYLNKFVDYSLSPLSNQSKSGLNYPVIRYAEILLLKAEVLNELQGPTGSAYTAINQVRERAGIGDLSTGLTQAAFRDSVFLERRKEFIQEGQRWFDLARRGGTYLFDAVTTIAAKQVANGGGAAVKDTLFPIPLTEIQLNSLLTQNAGW
ncbi:RagB/SusD family nutrient uptake outer membrane protein [Dinghuibacter silviterrae]|uniref:Putative outer membrane starch-binding protein n=1 Tax=Dinghuibacter silviterrae TaxID=1539049 RepID=A0A4V3GLE5_9BACT|nr:RagB/SusD family nutrient uptake outer membrane protein [Dinghuibacter silviterrae]TDW99232.1 putative outer membrane starch-binding protein [Dinghuibacter silviterrae]